MNKKAIIVGAASGAVAQSLLLHGEAFVTGDGEVLDPAQVELKQSGGQIAEIMVKKPVADDGLPNRMSIDRSSPHYTNCGAYVGVKLDGEEVPNCIEFNVSMGWVRLGAGNVVTRAEVRDAPRKYGKVEVYWRSPPSRQVRRQIARMAR